MQVENGSQVHPADKPVGIVLMVLNALGACGSIAIIGLGGAVGAVGGAAAVSTAQNDGNAALGAAAAGGVGAFVMIFGVLMLITCAINIYGAFGIMNSRKKGFMIVLVVGVISLLLNLASMSRGGGFLGIGLGILSPLYAYLRLSGQLPPKVVE